MRDTVLSTGRSKGTAVWKGEKKWAQGSQEMESEYNNGHLKVSKIRSIWPNTYVGISEAFLAKYIIK